MYIRRKVFSSYIDENGEIRYFSAVGESMLDLMRKGAGLDPINKEEYRTAEIENKTQRGIEEAKERMAKAKEEAAKAGQSETLSKAGREGVNLSRKGAGMEEVDGPIKSKIKEAGGKAKAWAKKTYGKENTHRVRNIGLTAAGAATIAATPFAVKALRAKKARKQESSDKE